MHTGEPTGSNAFFVRADLPGQWPDRDRVPLRGLNYRLGSTGHPPDPLMRTFVDVTSQVKG